MDQILAMKIFIRIAELESFSRAAEDLNLPRATVSTTLKRLEQKLGQKVLPALAATDLGAGRIRRPVCTSQKSARRHCSHRYAAFSGTSDGNPRVTGVLPALSANYPERQRQ